MWETNHTKRIIVSIFLLILIAGIVYGLWTFMQRVNRDTQAHDEQLSQMSAQQQKEQAEARQEAVNAIDEEYERDMRTVRQYLPGIICWGDTLTSGSAGGTSYPAVLQTYVNTYICDIYDFRSTIKNAVDFGRLDWSKYKVSIPVLNMGAGEEDTYTILGRSGAMPYQLKEEVTVPAACEPVEIKFHIPNPVSEYLGYPVTPMSSGSAAGINNVHLGEIEGTLSIDSGSYYYNDYHYYFTRTEPGAEVVMPAGTVLKTAAADLYHDYIHVVCIGTYGTFNNAEDLLAQIKTLLSRQTGNSERYIVLGLCSANRSPYATYLLDPVDTAMQQAFGDRFINVRKYLMSEGLADAGITPTDGDKFDIANGRMPPSFMVSSNSIELNSAAYRLIGKLIFSRMESLGYFDEVFEELGIRDTTKQILKNDPGYFDRMIGNAFI